MFNPSIHLLNKEIREKNFKNALSMITFFLFLPAIGIIFGYSSKDIQYFLGTFLLKTLLVV